MFDLILITAISVVANSLFRGKFRALLTSIPLGLTVLGVRLIDVEAYSPDSGILVFLADFAFWGIALVVGYIAVSSVFYFCSGRRHFDSLTTA